MKIGVVLEGDLRKLMGESIDILSIAVTDAVNRASLGLRDELRAQVLGAGLKGPEGLAKAWQQKLYPSRRHSMGATGYVYSKARRLHAAYDQALRIGPRGAGWRVVPLPGAISRGWHLEGGRAGGFGKPARWSAYDRIMALDPASIARVVRPDGSIVVGLRKRGSKEIEPIFLLVKQTSHRKRLDLAGPPQRWLDRLFADLTSQFGV